MRFALSLVLAACSSSVEASPDAGPACDPVTPGEYDLSVIPLVYSTINLGPRIELERDGAFVGHGAGRGDPARCEGTLSADEALELADALNGEGALCLGDSTADDTSDPERFDVRIRVYDAGGSVRECHSFRHFSTLSETPFRAVITALYRVTNRIDAAGGCTGERYEYTAWPGGPSDPPPAVACP
jgi:hypothetical protein